MFGVSQYFKSLKKKGVVMDQNRQFDCRDQRFYIDVDVHKRSLVVSGDSIEEGGWMRDNGGDF